MLPIIISVPKQSEYLHGEGVIDITCRVIKGPTYNLVSLLDPNDDTVAGCNKQLGYWAAATMSSLVKDPLTIITDDLCNKTFKTADEEPYYNFSFTIDVEKVRTLPPYHLHCKAVGGRVNHISETIKVEKWKG